MTPRLAAGLATVVLVVGALATGCGDGRPAFCDDLAKGADLGALTKALDAQDLAAARHAASEFEDLADGAPDDVRSEMQDLASAVTDIVGLLTAERASGPTTGNPSTTTTAPGSPSTTAGASPSTTGDPADVEQRREALNRRLADLGATSSKVEDWASHTCGITLT